MSGRMWVSQLVLPVLAIVSALLQGCLHHHSRSCRRQRVRHGTLRPGPEGEPGRADCDDGFEPGEIAPTLRCIEVSRTCHDGPDSKGVCRTIFAYTVVGELIPKMDQGSFHATPLLDGVCTPIPKGGRDCRSVQLENGLILPANVNDTGRVICNADFVLSSKALRLQCGEHGFRLLDRNATSSTSHGSLRHEQRRLTTRHWRRKLVMGGANGFCELDRRGSIMVPSRAYASDTDVEISVALPTQGKDFTFAAACTLVSLASMLALGFVCTTRSTPELTDNGGPLE